MTLLIRFGVAVTLTAALLPFAAAGPQGQHSCRKSEFWYDEKSCCLPYGGPGYSPSPPNGKDCPHDGPGWYWHHNEGCCVPNQPSPPPPNCDHDYSWDDNDQCCKPPNQCGDNEFWWPKKNACVPYGGPSFYHSPPNGKDCPHDGWSWNPNQGCCAPHEPNPKPPTCDNDWDWDDNNDCCKPPPPKPSGYYNRKRSMVSRTDSLCPIGLQACPIFALQGGDYECIDTTAELESCGGCSSIGEGQDCTAIEGAWNIGCEEGTCVVYTCAAGYRRSSDGQSCIAS